MKKKIGIITNIKSSPLTTNREQCNIDCVSQPLIIEWIDIKKQKPKEAEEYIITYLDYKKEKGVGSAWWNGETFEDWDDDVIEGVIGWMKLPTAM